MKIGILGSGNVGQALFEGFKKYGYTVSIGSRDVKKHKGTVNYKDAANDADIIVLAVKGTAANDVLRLVGNIDDKIIIDATNPISDNPPVNGVISFYTTLDKSQMERLQEDFPKAKFVKAFNSIGAAHMVNPKFSEKPTMFMCGNDAGAKKEVAKILEKFGFESEDMGNAESARIIEPLCILWCIPGFLHNDWNHAFRLLH
jgi:predicted dinucleotide-binding enzyme